MNTYLVSYDLRKPGKDYTRLHEHLKQYTDWAKPLESVWLLKSALTAESLRNAIQAHMDFNDQIFIVDVTGKSAAWNNLGDKVSAWIKARL